MEHSIEITSADDPIPLLPHTEIYDEIEERRRGQVEPVAQKSANQIFDERFKSLENRPIKSTTIFKVNPALRKLNPDVYTPMLISIGPYHRNNPQLRSMEKYKLHYLQRFLQRKERTDVEYYLREMEEIKHEALKCYEEIGDVESDMSSGDQFLEMMLLDGCFVVEFIRERCGNLLDGEEVVIEAGRTDNQVRRDLLLIENQLPFFVLTKLNDMTKQVNQTSFIQMAKETFLRELPKMTPASFVEMKGKSSSTQINHLLQVVHMSCHPSKDSKKDMSKHKDELTWIEMMPNATELTEAGVSFKKVGKIYRSVQIKDNLTDTTSLFDIKFKNGLMEIPCFGVYHSVESSLSNLIAYEQQSLAVHPKYFSEFAIFMDHLIDTDKDVYLLRQKGIIRNWTGEDKEVASFFNKLGKGVTVGEDFYYKEECRKVIQHCKKPFNRIKANLRHNYFHSPWAGVSTVAAIMLLLFTLTQTVLALISILKKL